MLTPEMKARVQRANAMFWVDVALFLVNVPLFGFLVRVAPDFAAAPLLAMFAFLISAASNWAFVRVQEEENK